MTERTPAEASGEQPKTMRAVVCNWPGDYGLEEAPAPRAGPDEVVVRVEDCGACAESTTVGWSVIGDRKELDVRGAHLGPFRYPLAIDYLSRGLIDAGRLVTHRYPLERFGDALETMYVGRADDGSESIKMVLVP